MTTLTAWLRPQSTEPGVPRWAHLAAHVIPLTTLPSGLWRLALGVGVPVGFTGELAETYGAPGWITPYVIVLSVLAEGCALLTLGLVRPWGERVPAWVPRLGGRRIPTPAAALPAAIGAVVITFINWTSAMMWFGPENNGDPDAPHGFAGLVMALAYAPMLLWGPLLGAVTVSYVIRRRRTDPTAPRRGQDPRPATGTGDVGFLTGPDVRALAHRAATQKCQVERPQTSATQKSQVERPQTSAS